MAQNKHAPIKPPETARPRLPPYKGGRWQHKATARGVTPPLGRSGAGCPEVIWMGLFDWAFFAWKPIPSLLGCCGVGRVATRCDADAVPFPSCHCLCLWPCGSASQGNGLVAAEEQLSFSPQMLRKRDDSAKCGPRSHWHQCGHGISVAGGKQAASG